MGILLETMCIWKPLNGNPAAIIGILSVPACLFSWLIIPLANSPPGNSFYYSRFTHDLGGSVPLRFQAGLDKLKIKQPYMALLGIITGTLTGLLGLRRLPAGTGFIYLFHLPVVISMGTSLAVIFPVSIIGSIFKLGGGYVDIMGALIASAGTVVGSTIGASIIKYFKPQFLKLIFSLYFLYVSIRFIL